MSFTSPLFVPTRRRPTISPCFTSRSCSTMMVSLPGEKRSIRWKLAIGSLVWRLSTTRNRSSSTGRDRKSTRLNSSHGYISYAVFCLKKKKKMITDKSYETHDFVKDVPDLDLTPHVAQHKTNLR